MPTRGDWEQRLAPFAPAPSELIALRELSLRTDTKFVLPAAAAAAIVPRLAQDYALLGAGEVSIATYRTLYFDTVGLDLYHAQRRGFRVRHKARIRHYPDRGVSSLEIKTRRSELETVKTWRWRKDEHDDLDDDDQAFVRLHTGLQDDVHPQVWTAFRRVTLLGLQTEERVTVDLEFAVGAGPGTRTFRDLAILEVKQRPFRRDTPVMSALRAARRRSGWMGKYFVAIALTRPEVPVGALRPGIRALERLVA